MAEPALVVLDARVPGAKAILAALSVPACIVRIDPDRDGLAQLVAAVEAVPGRPLVVICHGEPGALSLGNRQVTATTLAERWNELAVLGAGLAGAAIELYACSVAEGETGQAFVTTLERATGCPVAAASKPVGGSALGGTWTLDAGHPVPHPALNAATLTGLPVLLNTWSGGTGDWNTAGNWIGGVPGGLDSANIDNGGTAQLTGAAPAIDYFYFGAGAGTSGTLQVTGGGTLTANGGQSYLGNSSGSTGTLLIDGAGSAVNTGAENLVVGNSGVGILTVTDGGSIIVGGTLYTGLFGSSTGTLNIGNGGAAGIVNATTIRTSSGTGTVNFNHTDAGYVLSSDGTSSGTAVTIAGSTAVNQTGTGTTILIGTNTYTGGTTVTTGTLQVGNGGTAGSITGNVTNNATLAFDRADALTFSGVVSGTGTVTKAGAGTLTLSGTNTYTGGTTVNAGTLQVGDGGTAGSITGNVTNNATLAFDRADALTFSGVVSGTGTVTKAGAGTLTLSGTNTYTGDTTISAGTLKLSGGNAIDDDGTVNVAAGATLDLDGSNETIGALAGSGTVNVGAGSISFSDPGANTFSGTLSGSSTYSVASGITLKGTGTYNTPVTILSGGAIAPGNSPGTISTGNLTLASGSTASMEIDGTTAGTQHDQIAVTGTVTINGATLTTVFGYTSVAGDSYVLISNDGADAVTGAFDGLAEGATLTSGARIYQISYVGGDGNDVTLTDVVVSGDSGGISSASAAQRLVGGAGNETLRGGDGADTISAMGGDDQIYGAGGDDIAYGNPGNDILWGNADGDTLYGGQGADIAYGNQADDVLYGNIGTDTLYGGQGSDVLYGNLDDDRLHGNLGADTLYGGQGADTLSGGAGDDLLVGGVGADHYSFGSGDGMDTIGGFSVGEDVIVVAAGLNDTSIVSTSDLLARLSAASNGDAVLDLGAGNTVTLIGVDPTSLSASDFFLT
ncbi:MAG: DUF4347 domain-containing protein [Thalassobaculaceae bacterium]|nr:DUF4347 domain-containing protein [Thalassobaculaceae bacterium]